VLGIVALGTISHVDVSLAGSASLVEISATVSLGEEESFAGVVSEEHEISVSVIDAMASTRITQV
jgi:hypothetical protein